LSSQEIARLAELAAECHKLLQGGSQLEKILVVFHNWPGCVLIAVQDASFAELYSKQLNYYDI